jgi:DNA-binding transcriptional ArsR family regulator
MAKFFHLKDDLSRFMDVFMSDAKPILNPVAVLAALGNAQRLQIVGLMARGEELTINGLAQSTGRTYRAVHKDMDVLYAAGAVAVKYGQDGRVGLFHIPEPYRPLLGVVDYGFCALRFGDAAKAAAKGPLTKD